MLLTLEDCRVDLDAQVVRRDAEAVRLTEHEHALLAYLSARPGEDVSRAALLEAVWGWRARGSTRAVDNTMMRLRAKIERTPARPRHLLTVRGVGYRFEGPTPTRADHGLFGADAALGRLLRASDGGGVVTLFGPGGVGKTALARALLLQRPGVFCSLEGCQSTTDAVCALAQALRLPQPTASALLAHLPTMPASVVVLDNFEQMEANAEPLLARWRDAAPALTFLVTSRRRLRLAGARTEALSPLDDEAAVALLQARSGRARAAATDAERALVNQLDNLPLAIELLAGWSDLGGTAQLRAWLRDSLQHLQARGPAPERHRSLAALLEGSFRLLPPHAAEALAKLSVFLGFDLAGAAAVLGPAGIASLGLLRDHALVRAQADAEGMVRFSMLATIRAAARARLATQPTLQQHAVRAHAAHMADWARRHRRHKNIRPHRYLAELLRERANLTAALAGIAGTDADREGWLTLGLGEITRHGGDARTELRRLDRVFTRVQAPTLQAELVNTRATLLGRLGRVEEATSLLDEASDIVWSVSPDVAAGNDAFRALLRLSGPRRDLDAARDIMLRCRERAEESGSDNALAVAVAYLGKVYLLGPEVNTAQQLLEQAVQMLDAVGMAVELEKARIDLAQLLLRRAQHDDALRLLQTIQNTAVAVERGYAARFAGILMMQAHLDRGALDDAARAADILRFPALLWSTYLGGVWTQLRGDLALMQGDPDTARTHWLDAVGQFARSRRPGEEALAQARLNLLDGRPVSASPLSTDHQNRLHALLTGTIRDQTSVPCRQCGRLHRWLTAPCTPTTPSPP